MWHSRAMASATALLASASLAASGRRRRLLKWARRDPCRLFTDPDREEPHGEINDRSPPAPLLGSFVVFAFTSLFFTHYHHHHHHHHHQ
ncbi:predicted protein [Plenodomus lingam JN3]|uniref:Predicted protein n=1 Tax=Leptosphaeria maculans (strain JN3 / isolate v23.1.3 / race Av1-4-5-6-7-8) TaxID=985895 RepID=E4ZQB9_LEPMJ|nr:predicted protein [Plenodomus lingam JN3]CBX93594.1 predicted protein [Plenodomus lingam JN3]